MPIRKIEPMVFAEPPKIWPMDVPSTSTKCNSMKAVAEESAKGRYKTYVVNEVWEDWVAARQRGYSSTAYTIEVIPTSWGDCQHCGGQVPVAPDDTLVEHWPVGGKKPKDGGSRCPGSGKPAGDASCA